MRVWDIKDLGLQATQRIMRASHPLRMMQEVRVRACACVCVCERLTGSIGFTNDAVLGFMFV